MKKFFGKTFKEVKRFVSDNWKEPNGVKCPCCGKHVQLYRTKLNSPMARSLIIIYKAPTDSQGWVHVEDYFVEIGVTIKGVHGKLKHWGLLEQKENTDDETKNKNGFWRITELGRDFVEGKVAVNKAVYLYLDRVRDFDETPVKIFEALGTKFNYAELMRGEP